MDPWCGAEQQCPAKEIMFKLEHLYADIKQLRKNCALSRNAELKLDLELKSSCTCVSMAAAVGTQRSKLELRAVRNRPQVMHLYQHKKTCMGEVDVQLMHLK